MARRSGDRESAEDGYWDAISPAEDEGDAHLFWVPAHLHPEIAPSEFRAYLKEHARAADEESSASGSETPESTPYSGPARALSNSGLGRKKSMLSRQYRPSADDTDDEPQPVRRSRTSVYGGPQLTIGDLQKIDELAQDADPAKLRAVLRRSLSLNVAPSFLDKADALPDTSDEADSPIIVPRPGQILRRAARTKIRKPNLPGDGGGHRFASTRRATRTNSAHASSAQSAGGDETRSESDHTAESAPESTISAALVQALTPPHASFDEDDWNSDRPLSYTDESTIFDAYADRRDSMTSVASDEEQRSQSMLPVAPTTLDELIAIPPAPSSHHHHPHHQPEHHQEPAREPEPEPEPEHEPEPELHHPSPQRHLTPPVEPVSQQRTPSPARSHSASPASSDQHLPAHGHAPQQQQPPRKEKKGGLFGMGKKGKNKEGEKEKDSGFFGSLFGGGRSKKADDSSSSGAGFHGAGPAAAAALLGASKSKSPVPSSQTSPGPVIQPSANGTYARYPIHVERAVYRLSHIKLANPRRPLYEQVLISNLMFWYLGVINRQQQEEKERQAEKEAAEKEKKEKRTLTKNTADGRGPSGGQGQGGRRAEMPVKGPQYEMQNRQMAEEYSPQQPRPSSTPPERQYHLPNRQQRPHSSGQADEQFGYSPSSNGLPAGAAAPRNNQQQYAMVNEVGSYGSGPYPPINRPKSAGKGSSGGPGAGQSASLGRRPRTAEGSTGEDDVPLDKIGGSLGRRAR
ncbi:hypothetical protein RhiJN_02335 [Ceratobasidium sp. AG-Ba]|nr:hypothetical protein RhiJN_02335 [Ceratobasidium sp. AG-Ba]QRW03265.1 hypothetical protein RhiLY_02264 [Ceratobasidium sp. AG-Ba]